MSEIGVIICDCGKMLFAEEEAGRIASEITCNGKACEHFFHLSTLCAEQEIESFAKTIRENAIGKIVFAGCSPGRNQAFLGKITTEAGLTPSAVYGVNIKEQLFLHATDKNKALDRAIQSIQKAVNALSEIPSFETARVPLHQDVLVIGGGIAGVTAAQAIHRFGYAVTVVEQTDKIGGQRLPTLSPDQEDDPSADIASGIDLLIRSSLIELNGNIGAFSARIKTPDGEKTVQCGVVVIASGIPALDGINRGSYILSTFDTRLAIADLAKRRGLRSIGLVLDMELDESKASTEMALKLAGQIQEMQRYQAYFFCRDVRVAAKELELLYDEAREAGVGIIKYEGELSFDETEKGVIVTYTDSVLRQEMAVYCDRIVMSPLGISASADAQLAELTEISTDAYGQMQDNNIHLFPEQTNRPGIFLVGACRGQHYVPRIIAEAKAAALEVHALLSQKSLEIELSNAVVDPDKCVLCLTCIRSCPYKAMQVNREKGVAESVAQVCQKCGICAGECPAKAITLPVYSDSVLLSLV